MCVCKNTTWICSDNGIRFCRSRSWCRSSFTTGGEDDDSGGGDVCRVLAAVSRLLPVAVHNPGNQPVETHTERL